MRKNTLSALLKKHNKTWEGLNLKTGVEYSKQWCSSGVPAKYIASTAEYLGITIADLSPYTLSTTKYHKALFGAKRITQQGTLKALFRSRKKIWLELGNRLNVKDIKSWNSVGIPEKHLSPTAEYLGVPEDSLTPFMARNIKATTRIIKPGIKAATRIIKPGIKAATTLRELFIILKKTRGGLERKLKLKSIQSWRSAGIPTKHIKATANYLGVSEEVLDRFSTRTMNIIKYGPKKETDEEYYSLKSIFRRQSKSPSELGKRLNLKNIKVWYGSGIPAKHMEATAEYLEISVHNLRPYEKARNKNKKPSKAALVNTARREILIAEIKGLLEHPSIPKKHLGKITKGLKKRIIMAAQEACL